MVEGVEAAAVAAAVVVDTYLGIGLVVEGVEVVDTCVGAALGVEEWCIWARGYLIRCCWCFLRLSALHLSARRSRPSPQLPTSLHI